QNSTGGKDRLGSISKQGDRHPRRLLIVGALSVVKSARARPDKYPWIMKLLGRRPAKVVAVALGREPINLQGIRLVRVRYGPLVEAHQMERVLVDIDAYRSDCEWRGLM